MGSYAFAILSVQLLPRHELNLWAIWEGWMLMLLPFATGGQEYNLIRTFASSEQSANIAVNGLICVVALALTILGIGVLSPDGWWLIALLLMSEVAMTVALTILRGKERYWSMVLLVAARWGTALLLVGLARLHGHVEASTMVLARFLPVVPVMAVLAIALLAASGGRLFSFAWRDLRDECIYALPLLAVALLGGGLLGLPRVVLEHEGQVAGLRELFIAQKVGMVYDLLFSRPLGIIWPQMRFKLVERRTTVRLGWAYGWAVLASGVTMPLFLLLSWWLMLPIFGVPHAQGGLVLKLLICNGGIIFVNTATMLSNVSLYSRGNTQYMFFAGLIAMAAGGIALLVVPSWNVIGINCLMVGVNLLNFILIAIFSARNHRWAPTAREVQLAAVGLVLLVVCAVVVGVMR